MIFNGAASIFCRLGTLCSRFGREQKQKIWQQRERFCSAAAPTSSAADTSETIISSCNV